MNTLNQIKKKKPHLFFWWRVEKENIETETLNYHSIKLWKSYRGASILCLLVSIVAAIAFMIFKNHELDNIADVTALAVLIPFIYKGHKWAILSAMIIWTYEKGYQIFTVLHQATPSGSGIGVSLFMCLIWWSMYMHFFYGALRVEFFREKEQV